MRVRSPASAAARAPIDHSYRSRFPRRPSASIELTLSPDDNRVLANLCGPLDENARQIEIAYDVRINRSVARRAISNLA